MARITSEERAKREAELETKMNEFVEKATYRHDPAKLAAMSAIAFLNAPFIARFGKELGMKLVEAGHKFPEDLLFLDLKSLQLSREDRAIVRKYQRRFLPRGFRQLEANASAFEEMKRQLPGLLVKVATEGL